MRLFLASESPRRKELLKRVAAEFTVESAEVEELGSDSGLQPEETVAVNAARKAEAVALRHPEDWVLGADTVIVFGGVIYGKPRDLSEARSFLRKFSGSRHECLTAVSLRQLSGNRKIDFVAVSQVRFRELDDRTIDEYLAQVPVLDKAGAYAIQECGNMLVESIEGELENITGLPVAALQECLQREAVDWSEFRREQ